jgi:hypothetical protein
MRIYSDQKMRYLCMGPHRKAAPKKIPYPDGYLRFRVEISLSVVQGRRTPRSCNRLPENKAYRNGVFLKL